jgi:hypothetical protein
MLLRQFAGPGGLWHFDRRKPNYTVRVRNPDRIFTRKRVTIMRGADGKNDPSIELLLERCPS